MLAQKVSGTSAGIWLIIPELLRLGAWDMLKAWTGNADTDIEPRIALQAVNESALCVNRIRAKNSLGHQGFQLANGMGRLVTDEQVHLLLNGHTMGQAQNLLINLGIQRQLSGHYNQNIIAVDPHRILSASQRVMPKKKKYPDAPAQKMLQTFFSLCPETGQPVMATMSSTGLPTTKATRNLLDATGQIIKSTSLIVADKEHFTQELFKYTTENKNFALLTPAINSSKIKSIAQGLVYKPLWAGYAIAETGFNFSGGKNKYRLIVERTGEKQNEYCFNPFLTSSKKSSIELLGSSYDKRWSIEEFFRFENEMGINRASTLNLNIRYGKLAFTMIAQAATYQLRKKLKGEYRKWDAKHLANEVLAWADGDIRVESDTIVITFYGNYGHLNTNDFVNLPAQLIKEGINPQIPWLYNYKLDYRFK